ncbi:MAG: hypothetical protein U5R06_17245 [candidate division KSB1 bacterium]|nr:hypothetical protein [candidate division KSB1 bacterium]
MRLTIVTIVAALLFFVGCEEDSSPLKKDNKQVKINTIIPGKDDMHGREQIVPITEKSIQFRYPRKLGLNLEQSFSRNDLLQYNNSLKKSQEGGEIYLFCSSQLTLQFHPHPVSFRHFQYKYPQSFNDYPT